MCVIMFCCIWRCWYLPAVFAVSALNVMYISLNSPSQLTGWMSSGGDPCGESWKGIKCSGSSVTEMLWTYLMHIDLSIHRHLHFYWVNYTSILKRCSSHFKMNAFNFSDLVFSLLKLFQKIIWPWAHWINGLSAIKLEICHRLVRPCHVIYNNI